MEILRDNLWTFYGDYQQPLNLYLDQSAAAETASSSKISSAAVTVNLKAGRFFIGRSAFNCRLPLPFASYGGAKGSIKTTRVASFNSLPEKFNMNSIYSLKFSLNSLKVLRESTKKPRRTFVDLAGNIKHW
jgi:hypothetical protein